MHFFYIDESGDTGRDLDNAQQPIFVLGGISVRDESWRKLTDAVQSAISDYWGGAVPKDFELHSEELLTQTGRFAGAKREECNKLALGLLDLLREHRHAVHMVAIDKPLLKQHGKSDAHEKFDCLVPYLLSYNYLVTYVERYVKKILGNSARGLFIIDEKDEHLESIDEITRYRRFDIPNVRRLKWLVEFSHPTDSARHPLIQLTDLVIFTARKFLECDNDYKPEWTDDARNFYASCYDRIIERVCWTNLIDAAGAEEKGAHDILKLCNCTPKGKWKTRYQLY